MAFETALLTAGRWPDFADLFGRQGACYGCWCAYFRLEPKARQAMKGEEKLLFMKARVDAGLPPGILAYEEGRAVGWLQVGPRADVSQWNRPKRVTTPLDDTPAEDPRVRPSPVV